MIDENFIYNLFKTTFDILPTNIQKINDIGTMNKVYIVSFNTRKLIIRLRENDKYAANEFQKETWFTKQCSALQIPTPRIYSTGNFQGVDYLLEEFIDGILGINYSNPNLTFQALGTYSKKIKSIPVTGYGLEIADFSTNTFRDDAYSSPQEQLQKNIDSLTLDDPLIELGVYNKNCLETIKHTFANMLSQDMHCTLNHGDLSLSNSIVSADGTIYWIDFGSVNVNLLYSEFANLKTSSPAELKAFATGFGISPKDLQSNLASYRLLSSFDKLRWALTTDNFEYITWYIHNAKNNFNNFTNSIQFEER